MGESRREGTLRSCSELGYRKVRLRRLQRGEGQWMVVAAFRCSETAKRPGQGAQAKFHVFLRVWSSFIFFLSVAIQKWFHIWMNNESGMELPLGSRNKAIDIGQGVVERLARWKVNTYHWGKIDADK